MGMKLLAALLILAGPPIPVETQKLKLPGGSISVMETKNKLSLYLQDGGVSFFCSEWGMRERWRPYEKFFRQVAADAPANPNANFGSVLEGIRAHAGSNAVGYCNAMAITRDGHLMLSFTHNRACFDSAGCNTDIAVFHIKPSELIQLADWLAAFTDR